MTNRPSAQYELTIEKLGGLGDGSGFHDGKPVFVSKSCMGDKLLVRDVQVKADFKRAEIIRVLTPGRDRVEAICAHYDACGGCSLQHLSEEAYRTFKKNVITAALGYAGFPDVIPTFHFMPANSRRRADFKVENGALAYVSAKSHERAPITACPILTPAIEALIAPLNTLLAGMPATGVQVTEADSGLDIQIESDRKLPDAALKNFAQQHQLARINHIALKPVTMRFGGVDVKLPPRAFLQAGKQAETLMGRLVDDAAKGNERVIEFFSGLGTYTFALAQHAQVSAYELDEAMVNAMRAMNHKNITATRRDLFKEPISAEGLGKFNACVINPPRTGAATQIAALGASKIDTIIMVSCNHATWGRDARTLKDAGYRLSALDVVDQFVYSAHIELVSVFRRGN